MDKFEKYITDQREEFKYVETDASDWEAIQQKMAEQHVPKSVLFPVWLRSAAAVLLIGLGCFFLFEKENSTHIQTVGLEEEMHFPDIALKNPNGEKMAVSDLKGKVVLVDFWASYCMMCTQDHCYYFKPLYDDYRDHGFEIYSVSVDSDVENWRQAIEKDSLNWIHVSDLMGTDSPVYSKYAVDELPTNYLLDEQGKIIARNLDASDLEKTLSSLLAYRSD